MAEKPCKSCNHPVQLTTDTCSNCGMKLPGMNRGQRWLLWVGLTVVVLFVIGMCSGKPTSPPAQNSAGVAPTITQAPVSFTITKDDAREGRPRKMEVLLPRRLNDADLAQVATAVRDTGKVSPRTFIGFRVEGQQDKAYWANVMFDPDYKAHVIGLSEQDYNTLRYVDLNSYQDALGLWMLDGALGHILVLYQKGGRYQMDSIFTTGKRTETYIGKKLATGDLRLTDPDNGHGEYYVLKPDGTLEGWGKEGRYQVLQPYEP